MFSIFNLKKSKYLSLFLLITLFTLGIFFLTQSTQAKPSNEGVFNPKIDWFYLKTSNDTTVSMGKKSSKLPTIRYEKGDDHLQFSMTGISYSSSVPNSYNLKPTTYNLITPISSTTAVTLETNVKTPNEPVLFYRGIDKDIDVIYKISNIPLKVKEEIVLKKNPKSEIRNPKQIQNSNDKNSKQENLNFVFEATTTAKPVKQSDGSIAFFDNDNNYLFQLDKPFMIDANLNRSEAVSLEIKPVRHLISDTFTKLLNLQLSSFSPQSILNNFIINKFFKSPYRHPMSVRAVTDPQQYTIILKADSAWLSTATYPVIIDPTITHNTDALFDGQKNRIADSNPSTDAVQLESSYGENANDPYTVLNLHFNEANGTQTGIRDYASTTRVITANGNASTTNYVTQLGMGNSAAFDGTGDYLSLPDSEDWNFGSGDFSIDFWVQPIGSLASENYIIGQATDASNGWEILQTTSPDGKVYFRISVADLYYINLNSGSSVLSIDRYQHVAVTKNGENYRMFLDGVLVGNSTYATAIPNFSGDLKIGHRALEPGNGPYHFNGYLDDFRILKGRALTPEEIKAAASRRPYSVYTSSVLDASASVQWDTLNWTEGGVATGNGEQPYSTNSLVAQWDFNDTSGTTLTASSSGSCTTACNGTLTNFAYTASQDQATTTTGWTANNKKWGAGSLMFDGVNDYVDAGNSYNIAGAFTFEAWIKLSDISGTKIIISKNNGDEASDRTFTFQVNDSNLEHYISANVASTFIGRRATGKLQPGKWYFVVATYDGGVSSSGVKLYIDGIRQDDADLIGGSFSSIGTSTIAMKIGAIYNSGVNTSYFRGLIDSVRLYFRVLSASEILSNYNAGNIEIQTRTGATSDPNDGSWGAWKPTTGETQLLNMDSDAGNWNAPQQIDGYTKLLLHMDGTDTATTFPNSATTTHTVTANGNAQVDTAQSKFGGGSALFDGTGDYLSVPDNADWILGGTFTVDTWIRWNAAPSGYPWIVGQYADASNYWSLSYDNGTNGLDFQIVSGGSAIVSFDKPWSVSTGVWYHIAVVNNGGTWKLFLNGEQMGTDVSDADTVPDMASVLYVGSGTGGTGNYLNGWLDELRISKGIARWTSNFTPPPRPYGSNVKASSEDVIKMEGASSTKFMIGAPQVDGNTVALWHFEETGTTTGTYLYDETANNNDATTTGTTVVDGIFGKARKFNGTSDYVSAANNANFVFGTGDFTIDGWVYIDNLNPTTGLSIVSNRDGNWSATEFIFKIENDNHLQVDTGLAILVESSGNVSTGNWNYVAVTRSGTSLKLFINGVNDGSVTDTTNFSKQSRVNIGGKDPSGGKYLNGNLDELRIIKGRALSPDEIAETYRMGANHHLTRQVSATDMSGANKLAFNIASDRPGTYLDAMLGESDYANYELASSTLALSTTTVLYIKGDEIASSTSIKDSSFSGKTITANGNARTSGNGKIGNAVYFDGTGDYLSLADSPSWDLLMSEDWTIDFWVKHSIAPTTDVRDYVAFYQDGNRFWQISNCGSCAQLYLYLKPSAGVADVVGGADYIKDTSWHHIAIVHTASPNNSIFYLDNRPIGTNTTLTDLTMTGTLYVGARAPGTEEFNGYLDEFRILKGTALTPDQIRQAYEYGLRTHQITIDFGATLQTSDLISNSTDYNFNITATTSGLSATTSGLYLGDKIIIKENLGGTEYTAQGTVNSINTTTGAITVPSWDTGSTFPSGNGYSPNATVFKWQREYFDLTGAATTTRNAITNLTLRPTNNAEGRTIYLDDFRYNTNYLTAPSSSAITSSNGRYLQYRAIFTSTDSFVSPFLSAFNTLYTSLADMFPAGVGISGDGFLIF